MTSKEIMVACNQKDCKLLHNIGTIQHINYNTREQVMNAEGLLTFDGVYKNVYENRDILQNKKGIFFFVENLLGKDNSFEKDVVPQIEQYCTLDELVELMHCCPHFDLGFHSRSHKSLKEYMLLDQSAQLDEMSPSTPLKKYLLNALGEDGRIKHYAYPYGQFNLIAMNNAILLGYETAFSVTQGNPTSHPHWQYSIYRNYIR